MTLDDVPGAVKLPVDLASAGIALGAIAKLLPDVAALLTIIWTLIRILETETVRGIMRRPPRAIAPAADVSADQEKLDG
ncbi:hypothetical protein [Sphingomonas sp. Leaf37]|uniref:hypothetical protein n=1 Tax=Sphingomonas sp. Leaf37 TaxID=2876552 RepID=UPI001E43E48F|nr:hypothetical protein [Sphingomonas sp. Leaf37]